jgi:hypothetical protein
VGLSGPLLQFARTLLGRYTVGFCVLSVQPVEDYFEKTSPTT